MGQSRNRRKSAGAAKPVPKLKLGVIDGSQAQQVEVKQEKASTGTTPPSEFISQKEGAAALTSPPVGHESSSPLITTEIKTNVSPQAAAPENARKRPIVPMLHFPSSSLPNQETTPRNFAPKPTSPVAAGSVTARKALESQPSVTSPIVTPRGSYKDVLVTPRGTALPLSARLTPRCRETMPQQSTQCLGGTRPAVLRPTLSLPNTPIVPTTYANSTRAQVAPQSLAVQRVELNAEQGEEGSSVTRKESAAAAEEVEAVNEGTTEPPSSVENSKILQTQRQELQVAAQKVVQLEACLAAQQQELQMCLAEAEALGAKREALQRQAAALQAATAHARRSADAKRTEIEDLEALVHGLSTTLDSVKLQEASTTPHLASGRLTLLKLMHTAARALKAPALAAAVDAELESGGGHSHRSLYQHQEHLHHHQHQGAGNKGFSSLAGGGVIGGLGGASARQCTARSEVTTGRFFTPGTSVRGLDSPPANSVYSLHSTRSIESDADDDACSTSSESSDVASDSDVESVGCADVGASASDVEVNPTPTPPGFTPPVQLSPTSTEKSRKRRTCLERAEGRPSFSSSAAAAGKNDNGGGRFINNDGTTIGNANSNSTRNGVNQIRPVVVPKRGITLPPLNLPKLGQMPPLAVSSGAGSSAMTGSTTPTTAGMESSRPSAGAMARLASIRDKINAAEIILSARVDSSP